VCSERSTAASEGDDDPWEAEYEYEEHDDNALPSYTLHDQHDQHDQHDRLLSLGELIEQGASPQSLGITDLHDEHHPLHSPRSSIRGDSDDDEISSDSNYDKDAPLFAMKV